MDEASSEKHAFSTRINEICSDMELSEGRGRQSELARIFKVTSKAARRWVVGEGFPETDMAIAIAKWANVNFEWLMTGRGPKRGTLISTKGVVLDEALNSLPTEERRATLDFIRYKLERAEAPFTSERLQRYMTALDSFDETKGSKPSKGH